MVTLDGNIINGLGAATRTISMQMPHLEKQIPDLRGWHQATINVVLDGQLEVTSLDFATTPIVWQSGARPEMFGFKKITFENNGTSYDGVLYIAYNSPHRSNPYYVEVMLQSKVTIVGTKCKIHFGKFQTKVIA